MRKLSDLTQIYFKVDGSPLIIPPRYEELWNEIVFKIHRFITCIACTQDGKSLTTGSAVALKAPSSDYKFIIVAPSNNKADIIMSYIREFIVDCPILAYQLELDPHETYDRLRRNRSKWNLNFKKRGAIETLSVQSSRINSSIESAMGKGGEIVILDEGAMVTDQTWSTIFRMIAGKKKERTQIIKLGNPFYRNHLYRHSVDPRWHQIRINYRNSIADRIAGYHGYDDEVIEMAKDELLFDILFDNLFPPEEAYDRLGYQQAITSEMLESFYISESQFIPQAERTRRRLGIDQASGGDYSTIVYRDDYSSKILFIERLSDEIVFANKIINYAREYEILPSNCFLDIVNNHALLSYLHNPPLRFFATGINVGSMSEKKREEKNKEIETHEKDRRSQHVMKYDSLKAEATEKEIKWLKKGGKLIQHSGWKELLYASKFKVIGDEVLFFISKVDLKKLGFHSPDCHEGLMLTFAQDAPIPQFKATGEIRSTQRKLKGF